MPDMGDFKDVEIIEVLVKEGQDIKKNDSIITLESDKSSDKCHPRTKVLWKK